MMASIFSPAEAGKIPPQPTSEPSTNIAAVARVAYLASDVVLPVQSSLSDDSDFTVHLNRLAASKAQSLASRTVPDILPQRHNADPLLSAFRPLRAGKLVAVTAPSSILLASVPHLYKLAQYPIVLHVALQTPHADFSEISSIRQCGFTFLQSETLQEAQDIALTAHALAIRSGKGVIHFYDPGNSLQDNPIVPESRDLAQRLLSLDRLQPFEARDGEDFTLYADNGRVATITDLGAHMPDEQASQAPVTSQAPLPAGEMSS